jgi:hypothetical protein
MSDWPVRKRLLAAYAIIVLNGFGGFGLSELVDRRIFIVALAIVVATSVYVALMRCPRCRKHIFRRVRNIGGVEWTSWGGAPLPHFCRHCGWDLTKRYRGERSAPDSAARS